MRNNGKLLVLDGNPKFVNYQVPNKSERKVDKVMENNIFVAKDDLEKLEEKIDLKIKVAIQPIEGKIDNLPTQFENLLLKEREYQDNKAKETRRYIFGTIGIGVLSIIVSIVLYII